MELKNPTRIYLFRDPEFLALVKKTLFEEKSVRKTALRLGIDPRVLSDWLNRTEERRKWWEGLKARWSVIRKRERKARWRKRAREGTTNPRMHQDGPTWEDNKY